MVVANMTSCLVSKIGSTLWFMAKLTKRLFSCRQEKNFASNSKQGKKVWRPVINSFLARPKTQGLEIPF
jgi:hypothetical protein